MGQKIVVTGGAGFIGSHIVDALLADGHQVEVLDDLSSGSKSNLPASVPVHEADIRSPEAREILARVLPDVVVHCAAQISVRVSMDDPRTDTDINVVGLVNILQSFHGKKQPFVVFLSSGGAIYGEQEKFPADESHPIQPTSIYGLAKRVSEMYLEFWKRGYGLPFAALRLSNVYGPRQNPHGEAGVVAIFSERLLRGEKCTINGTGEQTRDFVFVTDVADAARRVVKDRREGYFNVGTGRETSVTELYAQMSKAAGRDMPPANGPAKAGEQLRSVIDPSHAQRILGWRPTVSFEEGIKKTVSWFASAKK